MSMRHSNGAYEKVTSLDLEHWKNLWGMIWVINGGQGEILHFSSGLENELWDLECHVVVTVDKEVKPEAHPSFLPSLSPPPPQEAPV